MRRIGLLLAFIIISSGLLAQDSNEDKDDVKKARKEQNQAQERAKIALLIGMVESKKFVLEANTLFDKSGHSYVLNSNLNFVGFDGENSTIQLSFQQLVGWKGVGRVAVDGKIKKMEIKAQDGATGFTITGTIQNKGDEVITMIFRVNPSGVAKVDMNSNFGERFSFQGNLIALDKTNVYKATPIY